MPSHNYTLLIKTLQARFEKNKVRHKELEWAFVEERLQKNSAALESLEFMDESGGEPDVIGQDSEGRILFCDCSAETPKGRRNVCYDPKALAERKEHKPGDSAVGLAQKMGIELLDENQYRFLQTLGEFDLKTSSWILTPPDIRERGGALFCDRRYGHVFIYHNGASSYYSVRGFRGFCAFK